MASAEIDRLNALRAWLITLDAWQDWVASVDTVELTSRISWPNTASIAEFPQMALHLAGHTYRNITGGAAGSNFQPRGEIRLLIWDLDEAPDNTKTSYEYFADHFFALMEELADKAHESALWFDVLSTDQPPIVHSSENENYEGEQAMWHGVIRIQWGTT